MLGQLGEQLGRQIFVISRNKALREEFRRGTQIPSGDCRGKALGTPVVEPAECVRSLYIDRRPGDVPREAVCVCMRGGLQDRVAMTCGRT
jgi:hypothetical protein